MGQQEPHRFVICQILRGIPGKMREMHGEWKNLFATIIGGGVLSLPIVFKKCGVVVTTVAMVLSDYRILWSD